MPIAGVVDSNLLTLTTNHAIVGATNNSTTCVCAVVNSHRGGGENMTLADPRSSSNTSCLRHCTPARQPHTESDCRADRQHCLQRRRR